MGRFKELLNDRSKALIFQGIYGSKYYFLLTLVNPLNPTMMFTIFYPKDYDAYLENKKYPNCTILLVEHPFYSESSEEVFTNPNMKKYAIGNYEVINNDTSDNKIFLVKFGGTPLHIQNKNFYSKELEADSFEFLFQIDEQGYPEDDDFLQGNYPFSYGALYIYAQMNNEGITNPVVGYWQYS